MCRAEAPAPHVRARTSLRSLRSAPSPWAERRANIGRELGDSAWVSAVLLHFPSAFSCFFSCFLMLSHPNTLGLHMNKLTNLGES